MTTATFAPPVDTNKVVVESIAVGISLSIISIFIASVVGWFDITALFGPWSHDVMLKWVELFATVTSFSCTYLCVKESRTNYIIGVITTAAYAFLFYQWNLLGSMVLNIYLVPTLIYGWFIWKSDTNPRPVERVQPKKLMYYLAATVVTFSGAVWAIYHFGGKLPIMDGVILIGTILAQFLLDRKKLETWFVWVLVNVAAIYTYIDQGLYLAGLQYVFFLGNTVYGYYTWKKSMGESAALQKAYIYN